VKKFSYKEWSADLRFVVPRNKYANKFKIDTGAKLTAFPKHAFKDFCLSKNVEDGEKITLQGVSGINVQGYSHKVLVRINDFNKNLLLDIVFYDGMRALLGMDMIKKHFKICFEKNQYTIQLTSF